MLGVLSQRKGVARVNTQGRRGDGGLTPRRQLTPFVPGPTGRVAAGGSLLLLGPEFLCGSKGAKGTVR